MRHFVYLMQLKDGRIYVGTTNDLERREKQHVQKGGGRTTQIFGASEIIYSETHPSRRSALSREKQFKGWSRKKKLALARGDTTTLKKEARCRGRDKTSKR